MRSVPLGALFTLAASQAGPLPQTVPTWQMNQSTIIMPCNYTGFMDPSTTAGWAIVDFDWSNAKGRGESDGWSKHKPMDCEEMLGEQVAMTVAASPGTTVWVYRNSIKALPWYTTVREKLDDPAYGEWFMNFSNAIIANHSLAHVPVCDEATGRCSTFYHDQEQTPGYPHGDGDCAAPGCDVGRKPVGEYLFNPLAANVSVRGQTFTEWFIDEYLFGPNGGGDPKVSGFFFDDQFGDRGPTEYEKHVAADLGLDSDALKAHSAAYWDIMAAVYAAVLKRGKFSWQQLWTGQPAGSDPSRHIASTCPGPLVKNASCAADLRSLCQTESPAQTRAMMYAFSPGGCNQYSTRVLEFDQDLANFLLVRGPYAWLGHGWLGCSRDYTPAVTGANGAKLSADYGEPIDAVCRETEPGVFVREWTKATVQMDCSTYTPTITMKEGPTDSVV